MTTIILLNNVNSNTTGNAMNTTGSNQGLAVQATSFGGGSVTLQISQDSGVTWITPTVEGAPAIFTSNVAYLVERFPSAWLVRATLTGATSPSNVYVTLSD